MTALQLNTEIYRSLGVISEDENMLKKVAKYLSRVAENMTNARTGTDDPTRMSKDEFYARIEEAERNYAEGNYYEMKQGESLEDFLKRTA